MIDKEQYLQGMLREIEELKKKNRRGLFRINAKISKEIETFVRKYFENNDSYIIETRKCPSCKGTWDIIVYFKK